jgi:hypothetical protein
MGHTVRTNEAALDPFIQLFTDDGKISPISSLIVRRYMATLQTHLPASLRIPRQRANFGNLTEDSRPYLIAGRRGRTPAAGKTTFIALPKESEDARITGATRSLERRLLALNLQGSRMSMSMSVKMTETSLMELPTLEAIFSQLAVEQDTESMARQIADLIHG